MLDTYALVNGMGAIAKITYEGEGELDLEYTQDFSHNPRSVFSSVLAFPSWESAYEMNKRLILRGFHPYQIVKASDLVMVERIHTYMSHDLHAHSWLQEEERQNILDLQDSYAQRSPEDDFYSADDWADDYDAHISDLLEEDEEVLLAQQDAERDEAYRLANPDAYLEFIPEDSEEYYATQKLPNWDTIDTTVDVAGMAIEVDRVPAA